MSRKSAAGRPTAYKPEYCRQIIEYFAVEPTITRKREVYDKKRQEVVEIEEEVPAELPTLAGFASKLGVHRDTLNQWSRDHEEFSDAIKISKAHQERILAANGLKGMYQPVVSIFALKNLADWHDKVDVQSQNTNHNLNQDMGDIDMSKLSGSELESLTQLLKKAAK